MPANARIAEFLTYDALLPKVSAVVSNGGFGGVQQTLALGIPLVVAGATEDKPEVAARVAWAGCGVNLRTGTPTPDAVRKAVRQVLADARYREAAGKVVAEIAGKGNPLEAIVAALPKGERVGAYRARPVLD